MRTPREVTLSDSEPGALLSARRAARVSVRVVDAAGNAAVTVKAAKLVVR